MLSHSVEETWGLSFFVTPGPRTDMSRFSEKPGQTLIFFFWGGLASRVTPKCQLNLVFLLILWLQLISNLISPCSNMNMAKLSQYYLYIICISFEIQFDFEKIMWHEAYNTCFASVMQ